MRRFWWLAAIVFGVSFVPYLIGSGWMATSSVRSRLAHARRQQEVKPVLEDLVRAGAALKAHRGRVAALSFVLKNANLERTEKLEYDLVYFYEQFQALDAMGEADRRFPAQFKTAMDELKAYTVPSTSVLSSTWESLLKVLAVVSLILTLGMVAVRTFAGAE